MKITRHSIEIEATPEETFDICSDVENWPKIFPPCKGIRILREEDGFQEIEITALADGETMTWCSERRLDKASRTIFSRQIKPSPLLETMQCAWRMDPLEGGVQLSLEHQFEVKESVKGLVDNVETPEEAVAFMKRVIHQNTSRELSAIKTILESRGLEDGMSLDFSEEMTMDHPPEAIYTLLQDAEKWPDLLPHCTGVEIIYDDGSNQEFIMEVDAGGTPEKIRTIRKCAKNSSVRYFQPFPPPVLSRHTGSWVLTPGREGTRVVSDHSVTLDADGVKKIWGDITPDEALERVKTAINNNSMTTMKSIAQYLAN
ncbi:MAG: SRPBCC family protein [Desulfobacter sp.]